jgi:hypothetical protein
MLVIIAVASAFAATPELGHSANSIGPGKFSGSPTDVWTFPGQIKIMGGSPGENKVLISDAFGLATWKEPEPGPIGETGDTGPPGLQGIQGPSGTGHGDGYNCAYGQAPVGVDGNGNVQTCTDFEEETHASDHAGAGLIASGDVLSIASASCATGKFVTGIGGATPTCASLPLSGTAAYIPLWSTASSLGDSVLYQSSSQIYFPATNGGLQSAGTYGVSIYDNEINVKNSGVLQLGYRNTASVRVVPDFYASAMYDSNNPANYFVDPNSGSSLYVLYVKGWLSVPQIGPAAKPFQYDSAYADADYPATDIMCDSGKYVCGLRVAKLNNGDIDQVAPICCN